MIFYLFFQIFISWLIACCVLHIFYKTILAKSSEVYLEPTLLTSLLALAGIDFPRKAKYIVGKILHHTMGICFTAVYYLMWYYEFAEISWSTSIIIALIIALLRIISWIILLEVIPSIQLIKFKGYYLQLVFVHNIFTFMVIAVYKLF